MSEAQTGQNNNYKTNDYEFYVLYIKDGCDYCSNAVELLKEKQKSFVVTDMTFCDRALEDYKKFVQHDTVPIVQHIKHKFIPHMNSNMPVPAMVGGFDDLTKYLEDGEPHAENVFSPFRPSAQTPPPGV